MPTQLTPHFTLEESLKSQTATEHGFDEQFNPPAEIIDNITALHQHVSEPVRAKLCEKFGEDTPLETSSVYRCARVNGSVPGSADHSQHESGEAEDLECNKMSTEELYQFIKAAGIEFDQLIQEHNLWAHVSYKKNGGNRGQCLRATGSIEHPVYTADGYGAFKNA